VGADALREAVAPRWNLEYERGEWDRLWTDPLPHYSVVAGLVASLRPKSVLDVGCGEGVLKARAVWPDVSEYIGLDVSDRAVEVARARDGDPNAEYIAAAAERWRPARSFEALLFVESLYYLEHPTDLVWRYVDEARPRYVIVSVYQPRGLRAAAGWRRLRFSLWRAGVGRPSHAYTVSARGRGKWQIRCFEPQ
jgi:2-polyprenyl-3-methyl-5-hydroxy-6-metoxy-1,4-benzoquinol methylase